MIRNLLLLASLSFFPLMARSANVPDELPLRSLDALQASTTTISPTATVSLSWGASATPNVTYTAYRETAPTNATTGAGCPPGTTGAGPGCLAIPNCTGISVLTCTDTIPTTAPVWYVVRAINSAGVSPNSNEIGVSFIVITVPVAPGTLGCTGVTVVGGGSTVTATCK